jgi:hypothetical protein
METASAGALPTEIGTAPRRPRRRRVVLWAALLLPTALGGLWYWVHSVPWAGPLVANSLRAVIGRDNVAHLEDFVYGLEDKVNRVLKSGQRPKAYWKVPAAPPSTTPIESSAQPVARAESPESGTPLSPRPVRAPFQPISPGPFPDGFAPEGDGVWVPMADPRRPDESPRLFKTLLHPDKSRSWAEVFVVAVDLGSVEVMPVLGYQEPRTEKPEALGYERRAKIPEEHYGALLGAFNGGFMAEHGAYGFLFDGVTFIDPRDDACTLARFSDGSLEVHTWTRLKEREKDMVWYRQAPACMFEDNQMHPLIKVHQSRKWGATLDGETVIRRSAVGLSADKQIFYVGITNHTTAKVLALGMHHAGAENVAQMDVNWSYPKFVTYEPDKKGVLRPVALAEGFEFSQNLYLRERSMRDFFYLARKEEVASKALSPKPEPPTLATPKPEEVAPLATPKPEEPPPRR